MQYLCILCLAECLSTIKFQLQKFRFLQFNFTSPCDRYIYYYIERVILGQYFFFAWVQGPKRLFFYQNSAYSGFQIAEREGQVSPSIILQKLYAKLWTSKHFHICVIISKFIVLQDFTMKFNMPSITIAYFHQFVTK